MTSSRTPMPIPIRRTTAFRIELRAMPEVKLPQAELTYSIWFDEKGMPAVESACLVLLWIPDAPSPALGIDRLPKRNFRVLDSGKVAIEIDSLGRVAEVEVTSVIP